ncbi:MAG TPA: kelch repeat-containing protein, partial [Planctomycetota bacterium]|nr:kelch repeat-containing protein [Planctomycetota bacterium]
LVEDPDTGAMRFGPIPLGPGNRLESCSAGGSGICGLANLTVGTVVTASSFLGNRVDVAGAIPFESFAGNEWATGGPLFRGDGSIGSAEDTRNSEFLPEPEEPAPAPPPKTGAVRPVRADEFHAGPAMLAGRAHHTASALLDGSVLLAGGQEYDGTPMSSCEAWSPETEAFEAAGPLGAARRLHAAAVLPDGRVLVCGGFGAAGTTLPSVEIFDPASRTWTTAPPMAGDRARHTATALADGRVLVAGGYTNAAGPLAFAASNEIFDPVAGTWSAGPAPVAARGGHTATRLADGRVLLAGGARFADAVAEVFDPASGTLQRTAGDPAHHRVFHAAALTESGRVLLAGGGAVFAEAFDPATGTFSAAGATPVFGLATTDSVFHGALVAIPGDRAVLVGGLAAGGAPDGGDLVMASVLLWDGRSAYGYGSAFPMAFDLAVPRAAHTVTRTAAGFLIAGGFGTSGPGAGSERRTTFFRPAY